MRIAIVGVGNCACTLIQALDGIALGAVRHPELVAGISGIEAAKIEVVAAFDVDARKVGLPLDESVAAPPNCTTFYRQPGPSTVVVGLGAPLDGVAGLLSGVVPIAPGAGEVTIEDVAGSLAEARADAVVLYLPVGSQQAADFYASAALAAGCSLVNCTPAVLANSSSWQHRFAEAGLVLLGDDMKSLIGSTTIHQALLGILRERDVEVTSTYQLNIGGNSDFLNMRDTVRASAKRATKTRALGDLLPSGSALGVGPSDYIPQLKDRKVGYIRIEATGYLGMPLTMELRLEVEDSPNAAPIAVEAIRLAKALHEGVAVDVPAACERLFKAPAGLAPHPAATAAVETGPGDPVEDTQAVDA